MRKALWHADPIIFDDQSIDKSRATKPDRDLACVIIWKGVLGGVGHQLVDNQSERDRFLNTDTVTLDIEIHGNRSICQPQELEITAEFLQKLATVDRYMLAGHFQAAMSACDRSHSLCRSPKAFPDLGRSIAGLNAQQRHDAC